MKPLEPPGTKYAATVTGCPTGVRPGTVALGGPHGEKGDCMSCMSLTGACEYGCLFLVPCVFMKKSNRSRGSTCTSFASVAKRSLNSAQLFAHALRSQRPLGKVVGGSVG